MNIKSILLAISLAFAGPLAMAEAQVIGGEVEIDGSSDDVIFFGGDMVVRGVIEGDIFAITGEGDIDATVRGDVEYLGGDFTLNGEVERNVSIAGGDIEIDATIGGNLDVAGGDVNVRGSVGNSAHLAGGSVFIDAIIHDTLHAGGGEVIVASTSVITEFAEFAGGQVELDGTYHGFVNVRGGEVTLSGQFHGDVEVEAEEVYVLDGARIDGMLRVRSPIEPVMAAGAQVPNLDYTEQDVNFGARDWDDIDIEIAGPWKALGAPMHFFGLAMAASAVLFGLIVLALVPRGTSQVVRAFRRRPLVSVVLGFIAVPFSVVFAVVLTVLLAIVVIGIPLIPFLWLVLPVVLVLGYVFGGFALGDLIFNRTPEQPLGFGLRLLSLVVVFGAAWLLGAIFGVGLGMLAGTVIWVVGLGAWLLSSTGRRHEMPVAASAAPGQGSGPTVDAS
ncbi:hypothetical protein [Maricaulis sp. CAU 1757]